MLVWHLNDALMLVRNFPRVHLHHPRLHAGGGNHRPHETVRAAITLSAHKPDWHLIGLLGLMGVMLLLTLLYRNDPLKVLLMLLGYEVAGIVDVNRWVEVLVIGLLGTVCLSVRVPASAAHRSSTSTTCSAPIHHFIYLCMLAALIPGAFSSFRGLPIGNPNMGHSLFHIYMADMDIVAWIEGRSIPIRNFMVREDMLHRGYRGILCFGVI
mmetsp:Transcript_3297/g.6504  ORF Transcript_3297/g.6504 Transcript_3297/m.6504 type:complete len:211 (-) Transcript_3297:157-789(-)